MDCNKLADNGGRAALIEWARPDQKPVAEHWLKARIPHISGGSLGAAQYAIVSRGGKIAALVAFHQFDTMAQTIQLTMAADDPRWCSKQTVAELLAYAFKTCGVNKLYTSIPGDNTRAIRVNAGLGLKPEAEISDMYGPGRSAVFCGMTRADWLASKWRKVMENG